MQPLFFLFFGFFFFLPLISLATTSCIILKKGTKADILELFLIFRTRIQSLPLSVVSCSIFIDVYHEIKEDLLNCQLIETIFFLEYQKHGTKNSSTRVGGSLCMTGILSQSGTLQGISDCLIRPHSLRDPAPSVSWTSLLQSGAAAS